MITAPIAISHAELFRWTEHQDQLVAVSFDRLMWAIHCDANGHPHLAPLEHDHVGWFTQNLDGWTLRPTRVVVVHADTTFSFGDPVVWHLTHDTEHRPIFARLSAPEAVDPQPTMATTTHATLFTSGRIDVARRADLGVLVHVEAFDPDGHAYVTVERDGVVLARISIFSPNA